MNQRTLITGGSVIAPTAVISRGAVLVEGGSILKVGSASALGQEAVDQTIDAQGGIIAPGFINLHVHGGGGADAMDSSLDSLSRMSQFEASHGTTGFLPTVMSSPLEKMKTACRVAAEAIEAERSGSRHAEGAQILGINVEGPFLNSDRKGAQPETGIMAPDMSILEQILDAGDSHIKIMTVAPEVPGALDIVHALASRGILVSAGHSDATYSDMERGVAAGVRHVTHTYNGMSGLHHREPGLVGATLMMDKLVCELILDGIHVHPIAASLVVKMKGAEGITLITDSMRAAGLPDGDYTLADQRVIVKEGQARLESGSLAGSTLTMDIAVGNMVRLVGVPLPDAIAMASSTPAGQLGLGNRKGRLQRGMDADITILDANTFETMTTISMGKVVFKR